MHPSNLQQAGEPLQNTGLTKRALNALMRGGIKTLEDAAEWSDRDLLSLPNFGPTSVASLRRLLGQRPAQPVSVQRDERHREFGADQQNDQYFQPG